MSARMQNLVRIRSIQERVARGAVARAQAQQQEAFAAEREVWSALERTTGHISFARDGAAMQQAQHRLASGLSLMRIRAAVAEASSQHLEGELYRWSGTAQRLEAVERLADRADERDQHAAAQAASNELDDLTIARHLMRSAS